MNELICDLNKFKGTIVTLENILIFDDHTVNAVQMKILGLVILLFTSNLLCGQTEFTFVFLNTRTDKEELPKEQVDKLMEGHMANMERLAKEDKLIAAGPFEGGGGVFVFKSNSIDEVKEWIGTDPGVQAKRWTIEILPYKPLVGSICKTSEPYEMVSYSFIRFWPEIKKYTVSETPKLISDHESYWKKYSATSDVITFASFGNEEGDILITLEPVDEKMLVNDPSIVKGLTRFDKKVLWIAKGSFCEN
jgi:uncharacterized protein YciI